MSHDAAILSLVDDIMEKVLFSSHKDDFMEANGGKFPLSIFDDISLMLVMHEALEQSNDIGFLFEKISGHTLHFGPDVIWPITSQMAGTTGVKGGWPDGSYQVSRAEVLNHALARRLGCSRFSKHMLWHRMAVFAEGAAHRREEFAAHIGGAWVNARPNPLYAQRSGRTMRLEAASPVLRSREIENTSSIALSVALTERYEWAVAVGFDDGPKLRLHSDPSGLRAMFRDRDKPETGDRRPALRHWVREHLRRKRSNPDDAAWVRKHFRGRVAFSWRGYDCEIRPSQFDIEQFEKGTA